MELDFNKLGLKAGLEVHQQLDTGKLFCRCPSVLREDKPDIVFKRKLRAVASELGEFDPAALEAFRRGLTFEYQAYNDTTCLIEADEEPPKPVNKEALETILKVALMSKSRILDELVVMRKAVIDGSNTSGFQKTILVALGGKLRLKNKEVGIQTLVLEEDAARPMEKRENEIVYRLDRLGIPLIELATAPELKSPGEVKECALKIGELLRRTCRAKRGLGTIRQDLNVSIAQGARVEIKGVQMLEMIDLFVQREAQRQVSLVELRQELERRGIGKKISLEPKEVSTAFAKTECKFLKGKKVFGARLCGFAGLLGKELQPGRRFGTEIADHVRAGTALKGILHSDELPAYGVSERETDSVKSLLGCRGEDAFILVQAEKEAAKKAFDAVRERAAQAFRGVPEETRNALEDGNTEYSRALPGAARMYPETDLEPVRISQKYLKELARELPLSVGQREKLYKGKGLGEKLVQKMVLSNKACLFEKLLQKGVNATTAAALLLETAVQLKREGTDVSDSMIEALLLAEKKGILTKDVFTDVLRKWGKSPQKGLPEILRQLRLGKASAEEAGIVIRKIVEENQALIAEKGMHAIGALMGEAMKQLKGKAPGHEISRILKEELEKRLPRS